jgi:hypothetical protein
MSQENVKIVRRFYPGSVDMVSSFGDPEGFEATRAALEPLVHPDFETVTVPGQIPLDWLSAWESWVVTPTEFVDVDENRVLVLIEVRARSKTHQVEMPIEGANLLTLRDGKLARLELFFERALALEAARLSE